MSNPCKGVSMTQTLLDFMNQSPAHYQVDSHRLGSARRVNIPAVKWEPVNHGNGTGYFKAQTEYHGNAKKPYTLTAILMTCAASSGAEFWVGCTCPDWLDSGGWTLEPPRPCKHLLSWGASQPMLLHPTGGEIIPVRRDPRNRVMADEEPQPPLSFTDTVRQAVTRAVNELASQIWEISRREAVPFLSGPTGCGKTSANRQ